MERLTDSKRLEKDVQIDIYKRPIKIAFFISDEENETNHLILDEIFKYSYTCWGGARFLILPLNSDEKSYLEWLSFYDADIVYSYIELTDEQIQKVEENNSPALLMEHDFGNEQKYFSVNIPFYNPVKSISTVYSPYIFSYLRNKVTHTPISLVTQFFPEFGDRFITDNFGNCLETNRYLNEIKEIFETYCLSLKNIPPNNHVGTTLVKSRTEILDLLANREATTVAHLARIHSESVETIFEHTFSLSFSIIVGSNIKDRISYWNVRHFYDDSSDSINSLIISEEQSNDQNFLESLGKYLSNLNFLNSGSGPYQVSLFSQSIAEENLKKIRDNLQEFTYNLISIPSYYSKTIIPTNCSKVKYSISFKDNSILSISENPSLISIDGPKHLKHIPLKFQNHGFGDFAIECNIDRHNNLSRYSNVIDKWLLPKRAYLAKVFGSEYERISKNKFPVLIAGKTSSPFRKSIENENFHINISLPDDLFILNSLLINKNNYSQLDLRSNLTKSKISYIGHSDKGRNFNGVISLFKKLDIASNFLTNKLWKDVFEDASSRNRKEDYIYTLDRLRAFQQKYRNDDYLNFIKNKLNFNKTTHSSQYLTSCFKDAFDDLIKFKIFHPIYTWSCSYCGYKNLKTVDSIKLLNNCEICEEFHTIPTTEDFSWDYLLNKFIHKTIFEHDGFNVLWALDYIQSISYKNSFLYLPEVNIYYNIKNSKQLNEIDLLGIYDGIFFTGEAKRSADYFLLRDREVDKFIELIEYIAPDEAFLAFEKYSQDVEKTDQIRSNLEDFKARFKAQFKNIKLSILIYEDLKKVNPSIDFGTLGRNVYSFFEKIDSQ